MQARLGSKLSSPTDSLTQLPTANKYNRREQSQWATETRVPRKCVVLTFTGHVKGHSLRLMHPTFPQAVGLGGMAQRSSCPLTHMQMLIVYAECPKYSLHLGPQVCSSTNIS